VANSVGFAPGVRKWRWTCLGGRGRCNGHRRELDSNWFGFMESRHRIEVVCTKSINSHSTSKLSEPSDRPRYIILNRSAWPTGYEYTTTSPLDKIPDPLVGGRCPTVFVQKKKDPGPSSSLGQRRGRGGVELGGIGLQLKTIWQIGSVMTWRRSWKWLELAVLHSWFGAKLNSNLNWSASL
jgi:hypothetical protein